MVPKKFNWASSTTLLHCALLLILLNTDCNTNCAQPSDFLDDDEESAFYIRPDLEDSLYQSTGGTKNAPTSADLTLLTIVTGLTTEPLARFTRTADFNGFREGIDYKIIEQKKKADQQQHDWPLLSDSTKLTRLRGAIKTLAESVKGRDRDQIILYVDSESSLILGSSRQILDEFQKTGASILFSTSAEDTCGLYNHGKSNKNTTFSTNQTELINFDGFIGYASSLHELLQHQPLAFKNFKHLIASVYYGNESLRSALNLRLDLTSSIFYTIKSTDYSSRDVKLELNVKGSVIRPKLVTNSHPSRPVLIVQANVCETNAYMNNAILNYYGNYLTPTLPQDKITLNPKFSSKWPTITMAIFIEKPTPFVEEFFNHIEHLKYNKSLIHLFVHVQFKYNVGHVDEFLARVGPDYASVKLIRSRDRVKEWAARKLGAAHALEMGTDYYFSIDGTAHLENHKSLRLLIESNKLIVAPLLCYITTSTADLQSVAKNFCNFWGTVNSDGLFTKSIDYKDISTSEHFGIWNVPYISSAYLINATLLTNPATRPNFIHGLEEADVAFATNYRNLGVFLFVTNEFEAGHLVNTDFFEINHYNNEMYQLFDNRYDWERRYLHRNYYDVLSKKDYGGKNLKPEEPCQDVFWFPIVTERFAREMIGEMERYGKWADGSIEARGDPYPTVDIQMEEVGFHWHWHEFMRLYIKPLQELVFSGYEVYPPRTDQVFVVKYSAIDQRELKPHFDLSTYTINIALNTPKQDFEGGGCRFLRNNCSVIDTKIGWMMMHPGQLTHKHEGLKITKGLRYILVAFIDP